MEDKHLARDWEGITTMKQALQILLLLCTPFSVLNAKDQCNYSDPILCDCPGPGCPASQPDGVGFNAEDGKTIPGQMHERPNPRAQKRIENDRIRKFEKSKKYEEQF
jgi:hypothetical protein